METQSKVLRTNLTVFSVKFIPADVAVSEAGDDVWVLHVSVGRFWKTETSRFPALGKSQSRRRTVKSESDNRPRRLLLQSETQKHETHNEYSQPHWYALITADITLRVLTTKLFTNIR